MAYFYLAWRYIVYNKVKTLTLVACITLICFLPIALKMLLNGSEQQLLSRAVTTPLLVGAKGNSLDLVMNSLYFSDDTPGFIKMKSMNQIYESELALPIPIYRRFHAGGYPIVGTTIDYFDFRKLSITDGRVFAVLGECVIGADVAEQLGLSVGDKLLSSPENLFDLAGVYPLQMTVSGILASSHSADDQAVFIDLKTAWVIQGLGHGHQDAKTLQNSNAVIQRTEEQLTLSETVKQYTEITQQNLASFHFHGDPSIYPITAIIAVPSDSKSATILRGRYLTENAAEQIVRPQQVITELLSNIFRIKSFVDAVVLIVSAAMIMVIILVFNLSLRLRQNEINTIFHLGCSQGTIVQLVSAEIFIILLSSALLCGVLLFMLHCYQAEIVHQLFIS